MGQILPIQQVRNHGSSPPESCRSCCAREIISVLRSKDEELWNDTANHQEVDDRIGKYKIRGAITLDIGVTARILPPAAGLATRATLGRAGWRDRCHISLLPYQQSIGLVALVRPQLIFYGSLETFSTPVIVARCNVTLK